MTDDLTDDIFWIQGTSYVCVIYVTYYIYSRYLICILYILYIAYICKVKSVCYINRTLFTSYIGEPT